MLSNRNICNNTKMMNAPTYNKFFCIVYLVPLIFLLSCRLFQLRSLDVAVVADNQHVANLGHIGSEAHYNIKRGLVIILREALHHTNLHTLGEDVRQTRRHNGRADLKLGVLRKLAHLHLVG